MIHVIVLFLHVTNMASPECVPPLLTLSLPAAPPSWAKNASRRAHCGAAPAAPIRCASVQPQAGAELTRPCALNTGAFPLRLPAMLAVLYGALSHRSEEHTSELQSLMSISSDVFCLKKKKNNHHQ